MGWRKKETPNTWSGAPAGSTRPAPGCSHNRNTAVSRRTLNKQVLVLLRCLQPGCGFEWEEFEA